MTQEQKAKAYDEALNKAKIEINTKGIGEAVNLCYQLFPQLAENDDEESEDERIRKWLYDLVDEGAYLCERPFATESILAWLEKHKESLHIPETCKENAEKQTDEEKEYIRTIKSIISDFIRDKKPENLAYYQRIYDWLDGRHVPFSCGHENDAKWSEEDENALKYIHELLVFGYTEKFMDAQTAHDMRKWVNEHLRPDTFQNGNSHWKPSEEQMDRLFSIVAALRKDCCDDMADFLASIYHNLKKLM